jgi:hypothetical protein
MIACNSSTSGYEDCHTPVASAAGREGYAWGGTVEESACTPKAMVRPVTATAANWSVSLSWAFIFTAERRLRCNR